MDAIGQGTLSVDRKISSLVKPPDVVWLRVWCCLLFLSLYFKAVKYTVKASIKVKVIKG
jgi:hypothetical protein